MPGSRWMWGWLSPLAVAAGLLLPGAARAGTYSWALPQQFPTSGGPAGGSGGGGSAGDGGAAYIPALSVQAPRTGRDVAGPALTLSGRAGTLGRDIPRVTVYLYTLSGLDGRSLGARTVAVRGAAWSLRWPRALPLGLYTAVIAQADAYGHVAFLLDRFMVVPRHRSSRSRPRARRVTTRRSAATSRSARR